MALLPQEIQAEETEVKGFQPLPIGYYKAVAISEEERQTKAGDGTYVKVEFDITGPEKFSKRKIWCNYNIINKNATASKIALEQLGNFAWARH